MYRYLPVYVRLAILFMYKYLTNYVEVSTCLCTSIYLLMLQISTYLFTIIYMFLLCTRYLTIFLQVSIWLCTGIYLFMYMYLSIYVPVCVLHRIVSEWSRLILWRLCEIWTHCARSRNILKQLWIFSYYSRRRI